MRKKKSKSKSKSRAKRAKVQARLSGVSKSFGEFKALDDVSLDLTKGHIHAVLGENGAGKTTLVRILAGMLKPDGGHIDISGKRVELSSRRDGASRGIGIVQQHYGLVADLTGAENYVLGHPNAPFWLDRQKATAVLSRRARELGFDVDPEREVQSLTVGQRQRLEILIALAIGADILILDEPTAALVTSEVKILTQILRRLVKEGKSIVYITHKLDEVMEIADDVTVLRRGRVTGRFTRKELGKDALTRAMIGRLPERISTSRPELGRPVVGLHAVSVEPTPLRRGLNIVDLTVRRGEIVGVAGVVGNGQEALAEVLRGLAVESDGAISRISPRVAYIPEDRANEGLALTLSLSDNAILYRHQEKDFVKHWRLDAGVVATFTEQLLRKAGITAATMGMRAGALSGGNQQKLVIERELDTKPDLVVAHNPYRGLDLGAIDSVRRKLLATAEAGAGVVFISPDLDELFDISSRIVFLADGRITGSVDPKSTTVSQVGSLLGGTHS